jgi:hypothetical protein
MLSSSIEPVMILSIGKHRKSAFLSNKLYFRENRYVFLVNMFIYNFLILY